MSMQMDVDPKGVNDHAKNVLSKWLSSLFNILASGMLARH